MRWRQKYLSTTTAGVPDKPGLYAYGTVRTVCGLERSRSIVYVGQTDNLRRRLNQHLPSVERNVNLRKYLRTEDNILCWYCFLDLPKKEIRRLEQQMIKNLKPRFNAQHNPQSTD